MTLRPSYLKGYRSIHNKVRRLYGKANKCENKKCSHKSLNFEWANKDHQYNEDKKYWIMLCQICHWEYDRLNNNKFFNSKRYRRRINTQNLKEKKCKQCSKVFMPHRFKQNQKFCSAKCRVYNWWKINKEKKNDN